jgi:hypothetical protein
LKEGSTGREGGLKGRSKMKEIKINCKRAKGEEEVREVEGM